VLFYINFITVISFTCASLFVGIRRGSIINAHMLYWGISLYVLYIPGYFYDANLITNEYYNAIFLLGNLGAIAAFFIIRIKPEYKPAMLAHYEVPKHAISIMAIIYGLFLVSSLVNIIWSSGGIVSALVKSRLDLYLKEGITKGTGYDFLLILPQVGYYLLIGKAMETRRFLLAWFLVILLSTYYVFTANTRLPIVFPIIAASVLFIHIKYRQNLSVVVPPLIVAGVVFIVSFSVVGSFLRNGQVESIVGLTDTFMDQVQNRSSNQLGYYQWIYDLYEKVDSNEIDYEYGKALFYYPLISFFPRVFWPDKPLTSSSNRLTELVYNEKVGSGTEIYTFTLVGEGLWQLGYLGAFAFPFLFIYLIDKVMMIIQLFKFSSFWNIIFIISMMSFVRAELPLVRLMVIVLLCLILYLFAKIRWGDNSKYLTGNKSAKQYRLDS